MKNAPNIIISCTFNMKSRLWRYIWYLVIIHYMFDQTIQLPEQLCHIFTSIPICWWIFPNISRYLETRSRFSILLTTFVIALETLGMCLWSPFVLARPTPEKINWSNYDVVVKVFLSSNSHIINFSKKFFFWKSYFWTSNVLSQEMNWITVSINTYLFSMVLTVMNSRHVLNMKWIATTRSTFRSIV